MAQPAPNTRWFMGRGRGFRPQQPFKPARRPGQQATNPQSGGDASTSVKSSGVTDIQTGLSECSIRPSTQSANSTASRSEPNGKSKTSNGNGNGSSSKTPSVPSGVLKSGVTKLEAKYSYKANPDTPLGQPELNMTQGQKVLYLETFAENDMWWKVRSEEGGEGFVPASYVAVVSDKVTQLPWLAMKQTDEEANLPTVKPEWKPYVSAYNRDGTVTQSGQSNKDEYYCKVCDKQLNGPKPYGAHITSKAHKEEVELAKEYGTYED